MLAKWSEKILKKEEKTLRKLEFTFNSEAIVSIFWMLYLSQNRKFNGSPGIRSPMNQTGAKVGRDDTAQCSYCYGTQIFQS